MVKMIFLKIEMFLLLINSIKAFFVGLVDDTPSKKNLIKGVPT